MHVQSQKLVGRSGMIEAVLDIKSDAWLLMLYIA